ncbi:MAG: hypothetical protein V1754_07960 [Pseudomonadota bacterium]
MACFLLCTWIGEDLSMIFRVLAVLLMFVMPGVSGAKAPAILHARSVVNNLRLRTVSVRGKMYYRAFRVTSQSGFERIADQRNPYRFFQGQGQYGEAFYLFTRLKDARNFMHCEQARGAKRDVIAEVLLPKEKFDSIKKTKVGPELDWAMLRSSENNASQRLRDMRSSSDLVFGRWAPSPQEHEPFYAPMQGARQIGVVNRGDSSIMHQALIRIVNGSTTIGE